MGWELPLLSRAEVGSVVPTCSRCCVANPLLGGTGPAPHPQLCAHIFSSAQAAFLTWADPVSEVCGLCCEETRAAPCCSLVAVLTW